MMRGWALILAAGQGQRMGRPKALVVYKGETLLARTAQALRQAGWTNVLVVRGAEEAEVMALCEGLALPSILHEGWAEGMGSSIRAGMQALRQQEHAPSHVLITTVDQAHVLPEHFTKLREEATLHPDLPVAAHYDGLPGVPAVFPESMFEALMALSGDEGARKLLRDGRPVRRVEIPAAAHDLDTPDSLKG